MFTENDLRELIEFTAPDPVLSVYLNTEPTEGNADAYKLRLRNMLKEVKLPQDVEAVERYFNQEYNWAGRSVAIFSCQPQGFFKAYPLAIPVQNMIHVGDRPSIKPLTNLMDSYGGYGVVLVDQQGARLFHFHLGELTEQEGVLGEAIKRTKRGGASSVVGRRGGTAGKTRALENTVDKNMKEAADFAAHFFEVKHVRRVLICGTEDNIAMFRSELPKAWQSLVIGCFPMSMTASHTEVHQRALQVGQESEMRRSHKMVENLMTAAAKGGTAVVGLENTLLAINDSRVQTLIIAEGYHEDGFYCPNCNSLTTHAYEVCKNCESKLEMVPDVVESAISSVLRNKGTVEVVQTGNPLSNAGNIGAVLRY